MLVTHYEDDIVSKEVYLSMFSAGTYRDDRLSFKERIRHAWNIMRTGRPFHDGLILDEKKTKELGHYLLDIKFNEDGAK